MNNPAIFHMLFALLIAWISTTVGIRIHRGGMRARLRKRITTLRRARMTLLLNRREVRNAVRLLREVEGAGIATGRGEELHP